MLQGNPLSLFMFVRITECVPEFAYVHACVLERDKQNLSAKQKTCLRLPLLESIPRKQIPQFFRKRTKI